MLVGDITVEVRDKSLNRLGEILPQDLNMKAKIPFCNVGEWTISLPREHQLAPALRAPGAGIIVTGPADVLFSGPTVQPTYTATSDDPAGTLSITGITDEILLADARAFPQPSNPDATTQTAAHDIRTGNAETIMRAYVDANIGPSAPAARRGLLAQKLILAANGNHGITLTKSARFPVLGDLLNEIAVAANLGFRIVQRGSNLSFEVYSITDRTGEIRLDILNNTLASQSVALSAPTVTRVIIGGQGEQELRTFYVGTNATATTAETDWGRVVENFVDQRQTDDASEYAAKANEVLADGGSTGVSVTATPMDDTTMRYGYDWNLGDKVSVVGDLAEYAAPVTGIVMNIDSDGFRLGAALGDLSQMDRDTALANTLNSIDSRVGSLERNSEASDRTGEIVMWPAVSRAGWLVCNGSAVSRTQYADLFAIIGTTYGVGDGSTTFNLPNYTDRFPRGNTPGPGGGTDTHSHTSAAHSHTLSDNGRAQVLVNSSGVAAARTVTTSSWTGGANMTGSAGSTTSHSSGAALEGATDSATPGATGTSSNVPAYTGATFIIKY